jgi:large subunit ribosomal protein L35Ae
VVKKSKSEAKPKEQKSRLYVPGTFLMHRRSKRHQHHHTALVSIEGVQTKEGARWYMGKRVAYVYRGQTKKRLRCGKMSTLRVTWGRVMRPHGSVGVVRVRFSSDLPPAAYGKPVKVMLYPSNV